MENVNKAKSLSPSYPPALLAPGQAQPVQHWGGSVLLSIIYKITTCLPSNTFEKILKVFQMHYLAFSTIQIMSLYLLYGSKRT